MPKKIMPVLKEDLEMGFVILDGVTYVSSRCIAEIFEKRHDNIMRDICNLECSERFRLLNFEESNYKNKQGKNMPEILMTKNGFVVLVMGFTGKKAMSFKEAYIKRYDEMEAFIQSRQVARLEYPALTDAIKSMHEDPKFYHYSNEADMINKIVLGMTAKQFRQVYDIPANESLRDHLTCYQIKRIQKLQQFDCGLVMTVTDFNERRKVLTAYFNNLNRVEGLIEPLAKPIHELQN